SRMIPSARVRPRPVPRCRPRTYSRFISPTPSASCLSATHPAGSSPTVASRRHPDGGPYGPGSPASSCPKSWKQRSKPRESAYSPSNSRTGSISSAEVTTRIVGAVATGVLLRIRSGAGLVQVGAEDFQEPGRVGQRREAVALVEAVGVAGTEEDAANPLQVGVAQDALHQPLRQAATAVLLQHEHVAQPGERRPVGHDARQADLPPALVEAEAE